jgi:hypothetical protein
MNNVKPERCPLCESQATRYHAYHQDSYVYDCQLCGHYALRKPEKEDFLDQARFREKYCPYRLSALTREQWISGRGGFFLQFKAKDYPVLRDYHPMSVRELLDAHWPRSVPELLERALCNIARLTTRLDTLVKLDRALVFAQDDHETPRIISLLLTQGLIESHADGVRLSALGWQRVTELTRGKPRPENAVLVAMWFGDETRQTEMTRLYDNGIMAGVDDAGYRATRADLEEHNEYIMNKVLALIRMAPFVVADFTGHRNGVYFEAGFALGRGIPLICCCKHSDFGNAHFDTRQLNHILWETPEQLRERLRNRILGTIGEGPYKREQS